MKGVARHFVGNHKSPTYWDIVKDLLQSHKQMKCNMSLKINFLQSLLDFFPGCLGVMSDEQGKYLSWKSGIRDGGVIECSQIFAGN
ncbi:hypothetical protein PR048_017873 [Dryococelus australis]|uniref:Uncharacterized protein n=1 Tax=Dryococelus australis TaxID=614101 RepID=A0ABQ9HAU6_9NEOP|nr:hypothetical protein PR048_017873 [Dryococelus australis]